MKVVNSIRTIYDERLPIYSDLKREVDDFFFKNKQSNWHFESRVKELESFALKAETSRFIKISQLEDFFAATLVIDNQVSLSNALALIEQKFSIEYQRPRNQNETHKDASSFVFDDIRLYLKIPKNESKPNKPFTNVIFELQIKTFLQHAWSIATHDLVYKGDGINWAQSRIAHQVKAMLEHAELSISEAKQLSKSPIVNKVNQQIEFLQSIIVTVREIWEEDRLPKDLVRLAQNIQFVLNICNVDIIELKQVAIKSRFIGKSPMANISPFTAIVLSLLELDQRLLNNFARKGKKIFLPKEAIDLLLPKHINSITPVIFQAE